MYIYLIQYDNVIDNYMTNVDIIEINFTLFRNVNYI